nr:hypothetical protein HAGR004_14930 [Bdellovibrio sp. HAGR004]
MSTHSIAVVIPSYKVKSHILSVLKNIGPEIDKIYVVDDCCPENSGAHVATHSKDQRVVVLRNEQNLGVGGAVVRGYLQAANDGMTIVVKVDGDGQMDPLLIPDFIAPIIRGEADYTKGNRFYDLKHIHKMPTIRIVGNAILSFMGKISTGYWDIFDPTNGFTAIHIDAVKRVSLEKVSRRFFFETDLLFRLYLTRAVVLDIPMNAVYGDEKSNLKISKVIIEFLFKHMRNFLKRVGYSYYLRGMSLASLECSISPI